MVPFQHLNALPVMRIPLCPWVVSLHMKSVAHHLSVPCVSTIPTIPAVGVINLDFSRGIISDALSTASPPTSTPELPITAQRQVRRPQPHTSTSPVKHSTTHRTCAPQEYKYLGRCDQICSHCRALFWLDERNRGSPHGAAPQYHKCCLAGRVALRTHQQYPAYIRQLFSDRHFLQNIRAYNQMFAMTSFGANIDDSINTGRGPYVFRVSGQIYHCIGGLCPMGNETPRFLQLYIYDTDNEVANRLSHFRGDQRRSLREDIVEGLIHFLDRHNALVQLFRTARDKMQDSDIPNFHVRFFGVIGANQYELPTTDTIGAIVYEGGPETAS
ncbi:hypothetical protein CTI12_AA419060 [Artemisia annua]|uniref:Helitron helicase-like domain-containing protein n=1 Tax=Artemisia annua TaxID=35608 RepID=A0A2U1M5V5_ARTAN|nr:hypothetical protein CTI12_AA419060 [Artemisia annua]